MRDPYLYDDADVLRNLADIKDFELLRRAEADISNSVFIIGGTKNSISKRYGIFTARSSDRFTNGPVNSARYK